MCCALVATDCKQHFNSDVNDANGLTQQFVTEESCGVILMEFASAAILISTFFASRKQSCQGTSI